MSESVKKRRGIRYAAIHTVVGRHRCTDRLQQGLWDIGHDELFTCKVG